MTWPSSYSPDIWMPVFTVLLFIALAVYRWRCRRVPGVLSFAMARLFVPRGSVQAFASRWAVTTEFAAAKFLTEREWTSIVTIDQFIRRRTSPGCLLPHPGFSFLSIALLLAPVFFDYNQPYPLAWHRFGSDGAILSWLSSGLWVKSADGDGFAIVNILVFAWLLLRSPRSRWPVIVMVTGIVGLGVIFLLNQVNVLNGYLAFVMLAVAFLFLTFAFMLLGFHFLDPIRLARRLAIKQLHTGMLVVNRHGRVASLNPAAERILQVPAGQARGRLIGELLPAYAARPLAETGETDIELSLGTASHARHCTLSISLLKDWRGVASGYLLLLHDVTLQKQTQSQIIEQQQSLATLHERERIARELHDSIGQVLSYASLQLEAVKQLLRDGEEDIAALQLTRLGRVLGDAHADVRQHILMLHGAPSLQRPFFPAVQRYLDSFAHNYGVQTLLTIDPGIDAHTLSADAQLHMFRIMQEGLSNARRHGQARRVQVKFERQGQRICMTIQDDGEGFSQDNTAAADRPHFGLQFMQERAQQLGASLQVESILGQGTRVVLEMPEKEL